MKKFSIAFIAIVLLLICNCQIKKAMKPEIRSAVFNWGEVTSDKAEILTTLRVYNPNPFLVLIKKITCDFTINGIELGRSETIDLKIKSRTEVPIKVSTKIDNAKIPQFVAHHLKCSEQSELVANVKIFFDLKLIDFALPFQFKIPIKTDLLSFLERAGPIPFEKKIRLPLKGEITAFKIVLTSLSGSWGKISPDGTELNLMATIHNDNPYPLVIPKTTHNISVNGINLVLGETERGYYLAPNSKKQISTTFTLDNQLISECFIKHVRGGEKSNLKIETSVVFQLPEEVARMFGQDSFRIPLWEGEKEFKTTIFPKTIEF